MAAPNEITSSQLIRLIGLPDAPAIVDVSTDDDFALDPFLIPGAFRHAHTDLAGLKELLKGRACVIVCQKGLKLSQGVAAHLRCDGITAEYLQNGNTGWSAHPDAPRVPAAAVPPSVCGSTLWVTRHRPKIDRIACPWLIRRFVDSKARFLFVSPSEVASVAERFGAQPFDIEGVHWSHRGDHCTFDTMLDEFGLNMPALARLATVVRAADTNNHDLAPQAAGLLAISVGLSRQYRDDTAQMEAGMAIYDAMYRWARDGTNEGHDWPAGHRQ
ncbi:sulfurtransferase/chromate resistance protein [Sulfitobacter sp. S223]|uniref:sulfurtransferase/chromate resistance protein n=1 Tax=Sulfitobacter sp. S223 TaxID=2867023 RepID=UPI0021A4A8AA|nr:sulfurtransferase/chromate resistance protein [Sulfitobacter sp. S223]UWR27970.1 sulfurtransferase/chromate resistance protein [Sulfitobacter sp. S223]